MVSLQESMASSTNNSPYETLLDQVTALQSDLSKTFAVCQTLRAENETLAETLTGVKSENVKLRDKYSDIRKRYYDENKQRIEIEKYPLNPYMKFLFRRYTQYQLLDMPMFS